MRAASCPLIGSRGYNGASSTLLETFMPFVRQANPRDLSQLLAFDQMQEISAGVIESGNCIVAGFHDEVLAYAILSRNFYNRRFV